MNNVITYLFNLAFDTGISFIWTDKLKSNTPSCAIPEMNKIIINSSWHNQNELPFQIAHEIAHVLNRDEGVLYYSSYSSHSKTEANANNKAIDILLKYVDETSELSGNYSAFMEVYGIPYLLEENVKRSYAIYYRY